MEGIILDWLGGAHAAVSLTQSATADVIDAWRRATSSSTYADSPLIACHFISTLVATTCIGAMTGFVRSNVLKSFCDRFTTLEIGLDWTASGLAITISCVSIVAVMAICGRPLHFLGALSTVWIVLCFFLSFMFYKANVRLLRWRSLVTDFAGWFRVVPWGANALSLGIGLLTTALSVGLVTLIITNG